MCNSFLVKVCEWKVPAKLTLYNERGLFNTLTSLQLNSLTSEIRLNGRHTEIDYVDRYSESYSVSGKFHQLTAELLLIYSKTELIE